MGSGKSLIDNPVRQCGRKIWFKTRNIIRVKHYSYRTEKTYLNWVKRFFLFIESDDNTKNFNGIIDTHHVKQFLSYLAVGRKVSASTQNQALNALVFMFKHVLKKDLGDISGTVRAKTRKNLPVVLSIDEVKRFLKCITRVKDRLIMEIIYGAGLRLSELTRLRVKDIDFDHGLIIARDAKGFKDRSTVLPTTVREKLHRHIESVKKTHNADPSKGFGEVYIPFALSRKYPNAGREWCWQYVFPSAKISVDPKTGITRRHHMSDKSIPLFPFSGRWCCMAVPACLRLSTVARHR